MTKDEIEKLSNYFKKTFNMPELIIKGRSDKKDFAELYKNDEFLGAIYKDEEDGELSYNFSMAILDIDL